MMLVEKKKYENENLEILNIPVCGRSVLRVFIDVCLL
jgi:hypothetical protein